MTDPNSTTPDGAFPPPAPGYQPAPTYAPGAQPAPPQNSEPPRYGEYAPPQNAAPQNAAPQNGAPQNGAPQNAAPQNAAPQNAAPQNGAPQNGAPQYAAPQYGAPQYGAPQYGAPAYGAPQYGQAPTGWGAPEPAPRSRALGLTSMLIAIPLFVLSVIASAIVGVSIGPFANRTATGFSYNTSDLPADQAAALAPVGLLMGAQILVGTALGILALVLGIVAVATKRGRPLGIVGIIVSVAAPIVSFAVYLATLAASLPPA